MEKRIFSRSNVNERTLNISDPGRSSFDLSHRVPISPTLGQYLPVNIEKLMPSSVVRGSVNPSLSLEKLVTPEFPRTRLDTHTFAVSARRVNKDFRRFFEGANVTLPLFNSSKVFDGMLDFLLRGWDTRFVHDPDTYPVSYPLLYMAELADNYLAAHPELVSKSAYLAAFMFSHARRTYYEFVINSNGGDSDYGYMKDFARIEYTRLNTFYKQYMDLATDSTRGVFEGIDIFNAIYEIMKPYFGEGSIPDMAGYTMFKKFGPQRTLLVNLLNYPYIESDKSITIPDTLSQWLESKLLEIPSLFNIYAPDKESMRGVDDVYTYSQYSDCMEDESYLRVIYAAWYDGLRNWHLEERANLLDPDAFDSNSLVDFRSISSTGVAYRYDYRHIFFRAFMLLVPRFACYSRDFYTTVQTNDMYRFVFAPGTSSYQTGSSEVKNETGVLNYPNDFQLLQDMVVQGVQSLFPSGMFKRSDTTSSITNQIATDLQTMRRAGMLEKWLARNYFYPDTYAGQLMAHYGVKPSDFAVISSEYIGGSETMIQGDQSVAATGTEETPAGTRTFVGGAGLQDEFTYSSDGDFVYLVSFVSLVPLINYDCKNMHLHEVVRAEMPFPEFANDARVGVTANDLFRDVYHIPDQKTTLGYVPRYYGYRSRGDEAHGRYLTDYRSYLWLHDFYSTGHDGLTYATGEDRLTVYKLSAYAQHIHMPLDMFLGLNQWDSIAFGTCDVVMEVECPLPAAVEFI